MADEAKPPRSTADEAFFSDASLAKRLSDPIVIVALATAVISVVGSYFSLKGDLNSATVEIARVRDATAPNDARIEGLASRVQTLELEIAAVNKDESGRDAQHTLEWQNQTVVNAQLTTGVDASKQDLAVLRAELDGTLLAHERGEPVPLPRSR
jgi:hypothetical protein